MRNKSEAEVISEVDDAWNAKEKERQRRTAETNKKAMNYLRIMIGGGWGWKPKAKPYGTKKAKGL